jgi:hypothetical protein
MLSALDRQKLGNATRAALECLEKAGEDGLTTMAGIAIAGSRFPARVHDLRKLGYVIKATRVSGDRLEWKYQLLGYNADNQLQLFTRAA